MASPRNQPLISFFFYRYGDHRDLHSFPTRRSSDLPGIDLTAFGNAGLKPEWSSEIELGFRSEEHTSELQSQFHLVCRLLLEKKKTTLLSIAVLYKKISV